MTEFGAGMGTFKNKNITKEDLTFLNFHVTLFFPLLLTFLNLEVSFTDEKIGPREVFSWSPWLTVQLEIIFFFPLCLAICFLFQTIGNCLLDVFWDGVWNVGIHKLSSRLTCNYNKLIVILQMLVFTSWLITVWV